MIRHANGKYGIWHGVPEKMREIKAWYDGYNFAGAEMYNPWSVLKYFKGHCIPKPYWLDTSSNDIITEIVRDLPHDTAETLYALLVSTGYLKIVPPRDGDDSPEGQAWVEIPNRESGNGRFDIALFPQVPNFPGVIIEVKHAKGETEDLKLLAQDACDQIDAKAYATEMSAQGVTDILKLGLAFQGKQVELVRG